MTGSDIGAGARAHEAGKRRYWIMTGVWTGAIIALIAIMTLVQQGRGPGSLTEAAGYGFAAGLALAITLGSVWFFRVIDELDNQDNYIAFSVGFIVNMAMVIAWLPLFFAEIAGPPNAVACAVVASIATVAVYGWLKLRRG
jgi:hypothetical protein